MNVSEVKIDADAVTYLAMPHAFNVAQTVLY
jgi:hypothetical protein